MMILQSICILTMQVSPTDEQDVNGTWDSNYLAVYHMETTSPTDSANSNDGTGSGDPFTTSGIVGDAVDFDGTGDLVNVVAPFTPSFSSGDGFTVEIWINSDETSNVPISRWGNQNGFGLFGNVWYSGGGSWRTNDADRQTDDAWHKYDLVKGAGSGTAESFRNAVSKGTSASYSSTWTSPIDSRMTIGADDRW